jgi:Ca2+-dependent lipid-binding protein
MLIVFLLKTFYLNNNCDVVAVYRRSSQLSLTIAFVSLLFSWFITTSAFSMANKAICGGFMTAENRV